MFRVREEVFLNGSPIINVDKSVNNDYRFNADIRRYISKEDCLFFNVHLFRELCLHVAAGFSLTPEYVDSRDFVGIWISCQRGRPPYNIIAIKRKRKRIEFPLRNR